MPRQQPPIPVLFVHHRSELGGAPRVALVPDPRARPRPLRAARLLPARAGGRALPRGGRDRAHRARWPASRTSGPRPTAAAAGSSSAASSCRLPSHVVQFRRTLRRHRFELVHFNDSPLIPAAWLARHERLPVVWHLRSALPDGGARPPLRPDPARRSRASPRRRSRSTTTSRTSSGSARRSSRTRSTSQRFHPGDPAAARAALGLPADLPVVSFFGFIYPSKGFREFIEAAARLRERGVEASYLIVGGAVRGEEFFRTVVGRSLQLADLTRDYESEAKQLVARARARRRRPLRPVHAGHGQPVPGVRRRRRAVAGPRARPPGDRGRGERRPGRRVGLAHGRRRRRPGRDGRARRRLRRRLARRRGRRPPPARRSDARALGRTARAHAEENFDPARNARRIEEIYDRILPSPPRIPILYVHHRPQLGGAPSSLAQLIRHLDPRFEPHVFCPEGPAADLFADAGAIVHKGDVSIFAHAWDSPVRGPALARARAARSPRCRPTCASSTA